MSKVKTYPADPGFIRPRLFGFSAALLFILAYGAANYEDSTNLVVSLIGALLVGSQSFRFFKAWRNRDDIPVLSFDENMLHWGSPLFGSQEQISWEEIRGISFASGTRLRMDTVSQGVRSIILLELSDQQRKEAAQDILTYMRAKPFPPNLFAPEQLKPGAFLPEQLKIQETGSQIEPWEAHFEPALFPFDTNAEGDLSLQIPNLKGDVEPLHLKTGQTYIVTITGRNPNGSWTDLVRKLHR